MVNAVKVAYECATRFGDQVAAAVSFLKEGKSQLTGPDQAS